MKKIIPVCSLVIALLALGFSLFTIVTRPFATAPAAEEETYDVQYVIYLGTNDKDTNEPVGTPDEVKAKVDEVLTKHFEGFTIQEANGGWTNDDGSVAHEYTVVIILSDTTLDKVHSASDDLVTAFNQSAVMIQANQTKTEFYSGK